MSEAPQPASAADYRTAFELAPVGLVLSRERLMVDVNGELSRIFGAPREALVGASFERLYPSADEFNRTGERIAAQLDAEGRYADDRVMRRLGGPRAGELFWCHVSGRALDPTRPHAAGIWAFEDLSDQRVLAVPLTPREREVAALVVQGLTSKGIGRALGISPRTVDIYRGRLMKKLAASTTPELVTKLLQRAP